MSSVFSLKFVETRSGACHSSNHLISATDKRVSRHGALQGSSKEWALRNCSFSCLPLLAGLVCNILATWSPYFWQPCTHFVSHQFGKEREREKMGKNGPMTWDCTKKAFSDNTDVLGPSFSKKWGTRVMVYKGHREMSILTAPNFPPINHTGGPKVAPILSIRFWHCNRILCKSRFLTLK